MENEKNVLKPYAVVSFEDGMSIIATSWAKYYDKTMIESYYPSNVTNQKIVKLLLARTPLDDDNAQLFPILKCHEYAATYEKALHKLELCEKISEVDSDDDVNMEKLKKTRHSRCIKVKEEDDGQETSKNKQKVLVAVSNSLWPHPSEKDEHQLDDDPKVNLISEPIEEISSDKTSSTNLKISQDLKHKLPVISLEENTKKAKPMPASTKLSKKLPLNSGEIKSSNLLPEPSTSKTEEAENSSKEDSYNTKLILKKLTSIDVKLSYVTDGKMPTFDNRFFREGELSIFPMKNKEDMEGLEEKLKSGRFQKILLEALLTLGKGKCVKITVATMMDNIMTFETGQLYCFKGKHQSKIAFDELKICALISKAAVQVMDTDLKSVQTGISTWLYQCKNNDKRLKAKLEKRAEKEKRAVLIESGPSSEED